MSEPFNDNPAEQPAFVRAFLAINLPLPVVRRLADEAIALKPRVAEAGLRVAWVPAANLHLTLKFLGPVRAEAVEAIGVRLGRGLRGRAPFDVEVAGLGVFPSPGSGANVPRVLWAGVRPSPALAALQADAEGWMEELGFAREERAFHPHLTLGRVKEATLAGDGGASLAALLDEKRAVSYGSGRITEVVLYESRTLARGAEYRALARIALGK